MGFRFRKSFKIAPGIKFNLNKKSVGVTFGTKGAHYTVNSKGTQTTSVGVPGTGLSYTDVKNPDKRSSRSQSGNHGSGTPTGGNNQGPGNNGKGWVPGCFGFVILFLLIIGIVNLFMGHFNTFFSLLFFISIILAVTSLFVPKLAFWTQKKTRMRALVGYLIPAIIFFILVGVTSGGQASENQADTSGESAIADSSSSTDSSSSDDSFDSSLSNDSSSESIDSSISEPDSSSASSSKSESAAHVAPASKRSISSSSVKKSNVSSNKTASSESSKSTAKTVTKPATPKKSTTPTVTGGGLNVSPGQIASVSAKGAPNASASIQVVYNSGPSTAAGLGNKTTDGNGNVSWSWKVGTRTKPGNYQVSITIGGKTITKILHVQ